MAEIFAPDYTQARLDADAKRLRNAALHLSRSGASVRHSDSLLLPDEETALHFFEAECVADVAHVLGDVGIEPDRISVVVAAPTPVAERSGTVARERLEGVE
jgi:hypothetical protein